MPTHDKATTVTKRRKAVPPRTQKELEAYVPYLVNRLASLGQVAQNRRLSENGVGVVVLRALSILGIEEGLTVNEIADRAFADQSSASRTIDSMVTAGLVERNTPEHDQRRREVALTPAGREKLQECWPLMEDYYASILHGIADEDLAACRRVLAQMIANVRKAGT